MGNCKSVVMLASSGSKQNKEGSAKQLFRLPSDQSPQFTQKNPLAGVNMDILHIREIQRQRKRKGDAFQSVIIESSSYKGNLLKRNEITSKIADAFKAGHDTFIFTGHGVYGGAMVIQTQENQQGQLFLIEELVDIFTQNSLQNKKLYILLDCCYAGKMALNLKQKPLPNDLSIQMFCSSGPSDTSIDLNNYGGLLICWFWAKETDSKFLLEENTQFLAKTFSLKNPFKVFRFSLLKDDTYYPQWTNERYENGWTIMMKPLVWADRKPHECQLI